MRRRLPYPVLMLVLSGCLQEGRPVDGRQLFAGRNVEKPAFIGIDKVAYVLFHDRTKPAAPPLTAGYDLWLANYETGESRKVLENVADRDSWRAQVDPAGVRYMMVDERLVDGGSTVGAPSPVATLVRLDLVRGVLERIPDVSTFTLHNGTNQLYYRTATAGSRLPNLHLRNADGVTRALGPSAGAAQVTGPGRLYYVSGEDRTLARITRMDGPVEMIRSKVTRFLLREDERWVVLQTAVEGKSQTVVLDLMAGIEKKVPGTNPCCWLGFVNNEFVYSESASGGMPGKLHAFDVVSGTDRVVVLPPGLADVSSVTGRPNTAEALFGDSQGRLALGPSDDPAQSKLLDIRPVTPSFTEDGRHFIYLEPDPVAQGEGRLMVKDGDLFQPPRPLSPMGALVPQGGYFFIADGERRILVFWAHYGRNASDLYFANHETGDRRVVAEGISEVTVTARRVFGIVRVSEQDLVGELVNKDLNRDAEIVLAHSVADATVWGARVAFVIRERVHSKNDGLWAIPIDGVTGGMTAAP